MAGANPTQTERAGHDALFCLRHASKAVTFDPALVDRYDRARLILEKNR